VAMLALSVALSRPYAMWDRMWHDPLIASLRGQRLPFANVFEPGRVLHYHFSGDVLAAVLQVLSADTIHASRALSLAHDVTFALMGASAALLMRGCGRGPVVSGLLAALATLSGPFTLVALDGNRYRWWGYSFHNFYTMSFRPHGVLFGLLAVAVVALLLDRSRRRTAPWLVLFALLGITDEVSTALLLAGLGAAWLVEPGLLADRRGRGFLLLGLSAMAMLAANVAFQASLAPGGPASALALVSPRTPGFGHTSLPLASRKGALALALDVIPTLLCLTGLLWRRRAGLSALALTLVGVGVVGLTAVEINQTPVESHRFMSAAVLVVPLFAFALVQDRVAGWLLGAGSALATVSSLAWAVLAVPVDCDYYRDRGNYTLDCRAAVGAHLGERPVPTYVSSAAWERYSGCRPIYAAGVPPARQWGISLGPLLGPAALARIAALPSLPVVCGRPDPDPVCAAARATCAPAGAAVEICRRP